MAEKITPLRGAALSPAHVEAMVRKASLVELVEVIPVRSETEFDTWVALRDLYGRGRFACPRCQLGPNRNAIILRLDAVVLDDVFWTCDACCVRGTRFEIVRLVVEDPVALSDFIHGEVSYVAS